MYFIMDDYSQDAVSNFLNYLKVEAGPVFSFRSRRLGEAAKWTVARLWKPTTVARGRWSWRQWCEAVKVQLLPSGNLT